MASDEFSYLITFRRPLGPETKETLARIIADPQIVVVDPEPYPRPMTTPERRTEERRVTPARPDPLDAFVTALQTHVNLGGTITPMAVRSCAMTARIDLSSLLPTPEASGEGSADAAWEALRVGLNNTGLTARHRREVIARHRPLIEAAIRATVTAGEDGLTAALNAALTAMPPDGFVTIHGAFGPGTHTPMPGVAVEAYRAGAFRVFHRFTPEADLALSPRETPVAGLDVERLARARHALCTMSTTQHGWDAHLDTARDMAAEYARLAAVTPEPGGTE